MRHCKNVTMVKKFRFTISNCMLPDIYCIKAIRLSTFTRLTWNLNGGDTKIVPATTYCPWVGPNGKTKKASRVESSWADTMWWKRANSLIPLPHDSFYFLNCPSPFSSKTTLQHDASTPMHDASLNVKHIIHILIMG